MKRAILLGIFSVLVLAGIVSMVQANGESVLGTPNQPDPANVPYLTNTMTVNGRIETGEYTGAAYVTPDTGKTAIYALYNSNYLHIGVDAYGDTDREVQDAIMLFIDVNHNNIDAVFDNENYPYPGILSPSSPSSPSSPLADCGMIVYYTDDSYLLSEVEHDEVRGVCDGHGGMASFWGTTNKSGSNHRQFEFRIDLHVLPAVNTQFPVGIWYGDYHEDYYFEDLQPTDMISFAMGGNHPMAGTCTGAGTWFYASNANSDATYCFTWKTRVTNTSLDHWMLNMAYAPDPSPETEIYLSPGEYEVLKTTDADMTFDGRIGHDEYYSSSYIAFQVPARCGLAQANVYIYSVYSDNYVYFGVDAVYDTTNNASYVGHVEDSLRVYVDSDYDGVLDFHPHSLAPKGNSPSIAYADSEWYMNTTDLTEYGAAIGLADSYSNARFDDSNKSATNHRMWELKASRLAFPDVGESFGVGVWGIANYCNWGGGYIINHTDYAPYQYPLTMLNDSGNWTNETEDNLNVSALANWTLVEEGVLPPGEHQGQDLTPPPEEQPLIAPQYYSTPMVVAYGTLAVAGVASYIVLFKAFALSAAQFSAGVATAGLAWLVLVLGVATGYFHL